MSRLKEDATIDPSFDPGDAFSVPDSFVIETA